MEELNNLGQIFEYYFKKRPYVIRKYDFLRKLRRNRRTNFNRIKKVKGYTRFKIPNTNRYIRVIQSSKQKVTKRLVGRALGKASFLRKNYYSSPARYMRRRY